MNKSVLFGAMTVASLAAGAAAAGTLEDVQARGKLNCGVTTGLVGFAAPDANGEWKGFDVAVCRAVAAAVLGDGNAVEFVPTTGKTRADCRGATLIARGAQPRCLPSRKFALGREVDLDNPCIRAASHRRCLNRFLPRRRLPL